MLNKNRWDKLVKHFGCGTKSDSTFDWLNQNYTTAGRFYHNADHINNCLILLDEFDEHISDRNSVELALWFHDVIYEPLESDNELQSAKAAVEFLDKNGIDSDQQQRIYDLIMATSHQKDVLDNDTQLIVDLDLAILGSEKTIYNKYEVDIRKEYAMVPEPDYRKGRAAVLKSFLDKEFIYTNEHFRARYEENARLNILRALKSLS
jgi:predicted metal-dependent HD superfamily phosphohydrolase